MISYVYLIEDTIDLTYKIGVAKQPQIRVKKLQTGNSHRLKLKHVYPTQYPYRLEKLLHRKFNLYHKLNEWYDLSPYLVDTFISICKEQENVIIIMKDNVFFGKNLK